MSGTVNLLARARLFVGSQCLRVKDQTSAAAHHRLPAAMRVCAA